MAREIRNSQSLFGFTQVNRHQIIAVFRHYLHAQSRFQTQYKYDKKRACCGTGSAAPGK